MTTTTRCLVCALSCTAAIALQATPVPAASGSDAKAAITAAYNKIDAALENRDADGGAALCAPGFVMVRKSGKTHTTAQMKANSAKMFAFAKTIKSHTTVEKMTASGNNATVMVLQHVTITGMDTDTHKLVTIDEHEEDRDQWKLTARGWKIARSVDVSEQATVNGNLIKAD